MFYMKTYPIDIVYLMRLKEDWVLKNKSLKLLVFPPYGSVSCSIASDKLVPLSRCRVLRAVSLHFEAHIWQS